MFVCSHVGICMCSNTHKIRCYHFISVKPHAMNTELYDLAVQADKMYFPTVFVCPFICIECLGFQNAY